MASVRSKMSEVSGMNTTSKQIYDKVRRLHEQSPKKLVISVRLVIFVEKWYFRTHTNNVKWDRFDHELVIRCLHNSRTL